ncbi:hypothetical protein [Aminobacter ciceronei]|uniref:Uncharacterized protein n=1 Tax=Aminobacter ciceronei TaxID=150723 RepID=A0ABR6C358_9HYPH|nr:hypothetical protein [Aminobacter ciceronei]MBA8905525.1 hypothetical protein [Aminobacter ciceronei]MBA9019176.1 hypothetical protein [Aminobacter ciceronei]
MVQRFRHDDDLVLARGRKHLTVPMRRLADAYQAIVESGRADEFVEACRQQGIQVRVLASAAAALSRAEGLMSGDQLFDGLRRGGWAGAMVATPGAGEAVKVSPATINFVKRFLARDGVGGLSPMARGVADCDECE